jgi:hypothetical protein
VAKESKVTRLTGLHRIPKWLNATANKKEWYTRQDLSNKPSYNPSLAVPRAEADKRADLVERGVISSSDAFRPNAAAKEVIANYGRSSNRRNEDIRASRGGNNPKKPTGRGRYVSSLLSFYRRYSHQPDAKKVPESFRSVLFPVKNWNKDGSTGYVKPSQLLKAAYDWQKQTKIGSLAARRGFLATEILYGKDAANEKFDNLKDSDYNR